MKDTSLKYSIFVSYGNKKAQLEKICFRMSDRPLDTNLYGSWICLSIFASSFVWWNRDSSISDCRASVISWSLNCSLSNSSPFLYFIKR